MTEPSKDLIVNRIRQRIKILESNIDYIANITNLIADSVASSIGEGKKLMFCGNGGSAAESQHMAAEYCATLDHQKPRSGMPAISLTTDSSLITAWSNDFGFEGIFSRQVETLGHKGDILMAYTTSGTSKNVCMAAEKAKSMGIKVIGFTGDHKEMLLEDFADLIFKAPATETPLIQEMHTIIGHEICSNVERILFNFK